MRWSSTVLSILCAVGVETSLAGGEIVRPKDFGTRRVRSHPLTIMALRQLSSTLDPKQYRGAEMSALLIWKGREGILQKAAEEQIPWHYHALRNRKKRGLDVGQRLTEEEKALATRFFETYPGCAGWLLWDEPRHPHFPTMAHAMEWFRRTFPETLVYSNLYCAGAIPGKYYDPEIDPSTANYKHPPVPHTYETYLQEYLDLCKPDLLMIDVYPFVDYEDCDDVTYISARFFSTLESVRKCAQRAGIPYWTFEQSFGYRHWYLPGEADLRMQVFASLAYGFTGIACFQYQDPAYPHALLDKDGKPTRILQHATEVNREVMNLGRALRFLTSTDVRHVSGRHYEAGENLPNPVPTGARAFDAAAGNPCQITGIRVSGISATRNALIGFFRDDHGRRYFMPVNLRRVRGVSAAEMATDLTLTFDPSVKTVWRLSRSTEKAEPLTLADGALKLTLPGGTGDLFKLADATFPGLTSAD